MRNNTNLHILLSKCYQRAVFGVTSPSTALSRFVILFPVLHIQKALETEVSRAYFTSVNYRNSDYSRISLTTPEPTVRPPSRIAKRRPASIATG